MLSRPLVLFLLWSLWLSAEFLVLGPYSYVHVHDAGDVTVPARLALRQPQLHYGFASWVPFAMGGLDTASTPYVFKLDSLLFLLLPGWLALGVLLWLQRFVAGYFTYRLCKDSLGLNDLPAVLAGLAYTLSNPYAAMDGYAMWQLLAEPGFPLVLWVLGRIERWQSWLVFAIATCLGLFFSFSAHWGLGAPLLLLLALMWFFIVEGKRSLRFYALFGAFVAAATVVEMPTLLALLLNSPLSHRTSWSNPLARDISTGVMHVLEKLLLALLRPPPGDEWAALLSRAWRFVSEYRLWLGIALLGWGFAGFRDRRLSALFGLSLFCGVIAYFIAPLTQTMGRLLGLLQGFQFDRFYIVAPFFAVIAGAVGLHALAQRQARLQVTEPGESVPRNAKAPRDALLFLGFLALVGIPIPGEGSGLSWTAVYLLLVMGSCVVYGFWRQRYVTDIPAVIPLQTALSILLLLGSLGHSAYWKMNAALEIARGSVYHAMYERPELRELFERTRRASPYRVASVGLVPAYAWAYGFETVDGTSSMYPQRYKDFWSRVIERLTAQDKVWDAYFNGWGNRVYLFLPLALPSPVVDLDFAKYFNLKLLSLANARYVISTIPLQDPHLALVPSGKRSQEDRPNLSSVEKAMRNLRGDRPLYIYENGMVFPRFFLANQIRFFGGANQLLEVMSTADLKDLRNIVFLQEAFSPRIRTDKLGFDRGEVKIELYSPERMVLSVDLDGSGILVASNSYSPYWRCKVDGVEESMFPADHTFWGVFLEEGRHEIVCEYRPPYRSFFPNVPTILRHPPVPFTAAPPRLTG